MRRPILAFWIALVAVAFTQTLGWSNLVGFVVGWLLLVAVLTRRQVAEWLRAGVRRLALTCPRWTPLRLRVWAQQAIHG